MTARGRGAAISPRSGTAAPAIGAAVPFFWGTALVVHEKADDERTDPEGKAGPGIACGVIERTRDQAPAPAVARSLFAAGPATP